MRVGIVGAGGMGNVHARHWRNIEGAETALFDVDPAKSAEVAGRWGLGVRENFEDLLGWADVVDLCVPTPLHLDLSLKAIAAGRALMVEKPLAGTLDDAAKIVAEADRAGITLAVGQVVRCFPEFRRGHELVASGAVGKPAAARTRRGGGMPKGAGLWFADHAQSGGVLIDLAIHDFDWLRWTLGEVRTVYSRSLSATRGSGPDYALTTLTFDDGAVAHVEATWMDPSGFRTAFEVCGSGGMIEFDSRNAPTLRTHRTGMDGIPLPAAAEAPLDPQDDPYFVQLKGFADAITAGTAPPVSGHDGLMAVSIAAAAVESARSGRAVAPARAF